jgi:protein disulfide-isomerase
MSRGKVRDAGDSVPPLDAENTLRDRGGWTNFCAWRCHRVVWFASKLYETIMKKLVFSLIAGVALLQAGAAESGWLEDLAKAQAAAKAAKKMVLLDFTGSDWCGACIKLDKEVYSSKEFTTFAKKNLVLVKVDFPKKKKQSDSLKKTNEALMEKYGVEAFPTMVILDSEGKKLGQEIGYDGHGPKGVIAQIEKYQRQ